MKNELFFDTSINYTEEALFFTQAAYNTRFAYNSAVTLLVRRHQENVGDIHYANTIANSYEIRASRLQSFFENKLNSKQREALNHLLWDIQIYIINSRCQDTGITAFISECFKVFWRFPSFKSIKTIVKLFSTYTDLNFPNRVRLF